MNKQLIINVVCFLLGVLFAMLIFYYVVVDYVVVFGYSYNNYSNMSAI